MVGQPHINMPMERIKAFCGKWKIKEFALFGSVLRDDFRPDSDVDVLVTFAPDANWGLLDLVEAEQELSQILGRAVDLVERECVEQSGNWIRRRHILENVRPLHVA